MLLCCSLASSAICTDKWRSQHRHETMRACLQMTAKLEHHPLQPAPSNPVENPQHFSRARLMRRLSAIHPGAVADLAIESGLPADIDLAELGVGVVEGVCALDQVVRVARRRESEFLRELVNLLRWLAVGSAERWRSDRGSWLCD